MTVYIGMDWDSKFLKCYWTVGENKPTKLIIEEPSTEEVQAKIQKIRELHPQGTEIHAIIEAGGEQWVRLLYVNNVKVHVVNPKKAKRFKESIFASMAKDDFRDALALLAMIQSPAHKTDPWKPPNELQKMINQFATMHESATKDQSKIKQQFRSYLQTNLPMLKGLIKDLSAEWVLYFFEKVPSLTATSKLSKRRYDSIMSKTRLGSDKKERFWAGIQACDLSLASKETADLEAMRVHMWVKQLRLYHNYLQKLNKEIKKTLDALPLTKSIKSIKGVGPILTILLFHCAGFENPSHRDELSIKLGASPVFIGSGTSRSGKPKGHVRMRKTVSSTSKRLTYLIGLQLTKHSRWAKAMYQNAKSRNQRTGTIYRRISRSFLRIVSSMMKNGTAYDEERYIQALVKNGVPWAQTLQSKAT